MTEQQNPFGDTDDDFANDAVPVSTEHTLLETARKTFLPWHKPRKQWIRASQWASSISSLADQLRLKDLNEPLRYLSLPGPDLLDVRSIQPMCNDKQIELQFVGLNSGDNDDANVALNRALINQVRSLPGIDRASEVVTDRFEHLALKKSIAYTRIVTAQKSFDVVNIDLCGSFAEGMTGVYGANVANALFLLMQHQAKNRSKDWLFFITTRSHKEMVGEDTMQRFVAWLNSMIERQPDLKATLIDSALLTETDFSDGVIDVARLSPPSFSNSFALGLAHWILSALVQEDPAWRADMLPHYEYHVAMDDASCDMLSLGFYCRRIPVAPKDDALGIARVKANPLPSKEQVTEQCREKIYRRVSERTDLDRLLHENEATYRQCLDDTAKLLASARYDEQAYREWAAQEHDKLGEFMNSIGLV